MHHCFFLSNLKVEQFFFSCVHAHSLSSKFALYTNTSNLRLCTVRSLKDRDGRGHPNLLQHVIFPDRTTEQPSLLCRNYIFIWFGWISKILNSKLIRNESLLPEEERSPNIHDKERYYLYFYRQYV